MDHLRNEPDLGDVLESVHANCQSLLSRCNDALIGGSHLINMHDESREKTVNTVEVVSNTQ